MPQRPDDLKKYNCTEEQYLQLMAKQDNKCAICHGFETKRNNKGQIQRLSVDHSHRTGKTRALLCNNCNRLVGLAELNRNPIEANQILRSAIGYLLRHEQP